MVLEIAPGRKARVLRKLRADRIFRLGLVLATMVFAWSPKMPAPLLPATAGDQAFLIQHSSSRGRHLRPIARRRHRLRRISAARWLSRIRSARRRAKNTKNLPDSRRVKTLRGVRVYMLYGVRRGIRTAARPAEAMSRSRDVLPHFWQSSAAVFGWIGDKIRPAATNISAPCFHQPLHSRLSGGGAQKHGVIFRRGMIRDERPRHDVRS